MSLIPFEDLLFPRYNQRYMTVPLANLLSDSFGQLQQLERELGQLQNKEDDGKHYSFKCNVAGYRPEELTVDVQGNELVIKGEHQQQGHNQSIQRTFVRKVTLPESVNKDSIQCNIDESGRLEVKAARKGLEGPKVNIPISFKASKQESNASVQAKNKNKSEAIQQ